MIEILNKLPIFLIPFLIGGLVFFSSIVAPNTFMSLDEKMQENSYGLYFLKFIHMPQY